MDKDTLYKVEFLLPYFPIIEQGYILTKYFRGDYATYNELKDYVFILKRRV